MKITAHPKVRSRLLSSQPVVIFSRDLEKIVWANRAGADLFGNSKVAKLISMQLPSDNPVLRQLKHAISQMGSLNRITRGIRLGKTLRSEMLQFEIHKLKLPSGETGYKVTHLEDQDVSLSKKQIGKAAIKSLRGLANAAAILDGTGDTIFASADFKKAGLKRKKLRRMLRQLKSDDGRMIKQSVRSNRGTTLQLGLIELSDDQDRVLAIVTRARKTKSSNTVSNSKDVQAAIPVENIELPETTIDAPDTEASDPVSETAESVLEERVEKAEDQDSLTIHPETGEEEPTDEVREEIEESGAGVASAESSEDTSQPKTTLLSSTDEPPKQDSVRFAWSVDQQSTFVSVSPELADVVGANSAAIVGRQWRDIAKVLGFDRNEEIEKLLHRRDTWSGKTVLWPVENTDQVVPVELAALPVFDMHRTFEGFRGFGKIFADKRLPDPEAIGMAFSNIGISSNPSPDDVERTPGLYGSTGGDKDPEPASESEADTLAATSQSNVVPLRPNRGENGEESLTEAEQKAFKTVGNHLREDGHNEVSPQLDNRRRQTSIDTSLLESLPIAVLVYRNDETLFANRKLLEISGYGSLEELVESGGVTNLLNGDETQEFERDQLLHKQDGSTVKINATLNLVPWDQEKALLLSFTPQVEDPPDILELTNVAEVQTVLDTTSDGIVLLDGKGRIISINASAEALFGLEFDEAVGQELDFLFAEESKPTISRYVEYVCSSEFDSLANNGEEAIAREASGGIIPVFLTITRMEKTGKLCAVIRDITNWKKTEEELIQSRKHAEKTSEQKSEFLAQVSHEIRTPLNAIIGFSDVMLEERFGPIENERYREYLGDIRRSGVHVLDIINELLDLSKIEAGKIDLTFEAVNLNELVAETVALLQPQANANRTIIRTSLSRTVPKVVADPRSIRQIILNLVSNAIKYSNTNSQVIVSTVYENNGEVALRVRDTGQGMTENQIEEAMKPFRQVHAVKEKSEQGTGLGLPLTKALVEANRAFFELESEPGNGTIAHVQFPAKRVLVD
ncbi:MAG: PAS domain S-box protein [Pseudomonadota bacterium]